MNRQTLIWEYNEQTILLVNVEPLGVNERFSLTNILAVNLFVGILTGIKYLNFQ